MEDHLVEDTGCKEEAGILNCRTVGWGVEQQIVVAGAAKTRVVDLEHHIADSANKAYTAAEADQLGVDTLEPEV